MGQSIAIIYTSDGVMSPNYAKCVPCAGGGGGGCRQVMDSMHLAYAEKRRHDYCCN